MGADIGDETFAIEELRGLSREAKEYLSHHMRNSVQAILSALKCRDRKALMAEIRHMVEDLERIGC